MLVASAPDAHDTTNINDINKHDQDDNRRLGHYIWDTTLADLLEAMSQECNFCTYDDEDPPMLFLNANDHLANAQVHQMIEQTALEQLKASGCDNFLELTNVEYFYNNRRHQVSLLEEPSNEQQDSVWKQQQAVGTKMDGLQDEVFEANEATCKDAFNQAWLETFHHVYDEHDNGALVNAVTLDTHRFIDPTPTKQNDVNVAATDEAVAFFALRSSSNNNDNNNQHMSSPNIKSLSTAIFASHMDVMIPKNDQDLIASLFDIHKGKQYAFQAAGRHHVFEKELIKALKSNNKCPAFQTVRNLSVLFQGKYEDSTLNTNAAAEVDNNDNKNDLEASSNGAAVVTQSIKIELVNVQDSPDAACFEDVLAAQQTAYNLVQSNIVVHDVAIHATHEHPMPPATLAADADADADADDGAGQEEATNNDLEASESWDRTIFVIEDTMTTLCVGCSFPTLDVDTHRELEEEMLILLSHNACEAFHALDNVVVSYEATSHRVIMDTMASA